jgi:hypothetical protein
MPLVVTSVPNLAQGVSQQPDNLRYPGQCDEQINAWATVVEGLVKRPNTRWINEFNSGSTPTNLFTHFVKRDEQNKYCVTVSLGSSVPTVGVIDLVSGATVSVATTSIAQSYLSGITNPLADLRALTVADYTFLVNKKKEVKVANGIKSKDLEYEALITVKLGDYEKNYDIYLDGNLVTSTHSALPHIPNTSFVTGHTYQSASSSSGEHADTAYIADHLAQILDDYLSSQTGLGTISFSGTNLGFENSGTWYKETASFGGVYNYEYWYEFELNQYSTAVAADQNASTLTATGIKGVLTFNNGSVQSWRLTHAGSGYDSNQPTGTYRLIIKQTKHTLHVGYEIKTIDVGNASTYGYTMPTIDSFTTTAVTYDVQRFDSVIKITGETDFTLRTTDGLGNEALTVAYKEVSSITDLPRHCFNNFRVKVIGDADIDQDDYYVRFQTKDKDEFGEGSWIETVGWGESIGSADELAGIETTIDNTTTPITLVPKFNTSGVIDRFILQVPNELTNYVEYSGTVYNLIKEHVSNTNNQPGSTVDSNSDGIEDWKEYWRVDTEYSTVPNSWFEGIAYKKRDAGYSTRNAGNDETNPFPSFVGNTINDVFFFKNRLGFLTDSNVIFSEADEYFNFFRTTTQQLLDSAPIDVGLSHTKVAVLQHALPFQEKLMLFSDNSQFVLRGADVLSPKTVAISPVTEYDISDGIAPLALGPYIYFPFNRGQFEGMFEYFVDNNTEVFEAEEITSQIPKYIPSKIKQMAGSASESMVLLQDNTDAKTLYVYKYFWSGKEKIQSAWQKWTFDNDVTGFDFIDSTLYLILDGKVLVEMPVENALTDTGLDYTLLLDNRVDGAGKTVSYNEQTNRTTISGLPTGYGATVDNMTVFTKGGSERNVVASSSGTSVEIEGFLASYVKHSGTIYKCVDTHTSSSSDTPGVSAKWAVSTDLPNAPTWSDEGILYNDENYFVVGKPYDMLYRFSNQALKQPTERGGRSASDYTYQTIRNASIEYADTGHFTVEVTSRFRDTYSYVYNPAVLSSISTLDRFTPESGHFRFGVQCRPEEATIEVKSSSALPVKLLAAEFESMVTGRSKRYGA